jgi:RimJ/RimL family protein N-acetyltransferase
MSGFGTGSERTRDFQEAVAQTIVFCGLLARPYPKSLISQITTVFLINRTVHRPLHRPSQPLHLNPMGPGMRVESVSIPQRDLLVRMYDRFHPLAAALGLPPFAPEARRDWIAKALAQRWNFAAISPAGELIGHSFLVPSDLASAELAVFVDERFRRQGAGKALVQMALERAALDGLQRVWAITSPDNRAALRLLLRCGFRLANGGFDEAELQIDLPAYNPACFAETLATPDQSISPMPRAIASSNRSCTRLAIGMGD